MQADGILFDLGSWVFYCQANGMAQTHNGMLITIFFSVQGIIFAQGCSYY